MTSTDDEAASVSEDRDVNHHDVCTVDQLRAILPKGVASDDSKVVYELDDHCRRFIELSPFVIIGSRNAEGAMDVSPKGDPPGFVKVIDERTLLIPERPGNRRCDTFTNVLEVPEVALLFLVPGEDLTLRVMGRAAITSDPALMETMSVEGRAPLVALQVAVDEAFIHCGKAPKRARLWDPESRVDPGTFPRMGEMLHDQYERKMGEAPPFSRSELGDLTDADYEHNVY